MNNVFIAGHLGADPETRFTSNGQKVTSLRVAARVRKDDTIWWRVTLWGDQFDKMVSYLKKGSAVMVSGELAKPEIYNDRNGQPQVSMGLTAHQLQFSPFGKPQQEGASQGSYGGQASQPQQAASQPTDSNAFMAPKSHEAPAASASFDDEVPF